MERLIYVEKNGDTAILTVPGGTEGIDLFETYVRVNRQYLERTRVIGAHIEGDICSVQDDKNEYVHFKIVHGKHVDNKKDHDLWNIARANLSALDNTNGLDIYYCIMDVSHKSWWETVTEPNPGMVEVFEIFKKIASENFNVVTSDMCLVIGNCDVDSLGNQIADKHDPDCAYSFTLSGCLVVKTGDTIFNIASKMKNDVDPNTKFNSMVTTTLIKGLVHMCLPRMDKKDISAIQETISKENRESILRKMTDYGRVPESEEAFNDAMLHFTMVRMIEDSFKEKVLSDMQVPSAEPQ